MGFAPRCAMALESWTGPAGFRECPAYTGSAIR